MGFKPRFESHRVRPDLELRPLRASDRRALFACIERNRCCLREWMPWLDMTTHEEQVGGFIDACRQGYLTGTSYRLAMIVDGDIAGCVALEDIDVTRRRAKIGYWLDSRHQRRGRMSDAVSFLMGYAFLERDIVLLELRAAIGNLRSRAVAERVGMQLDGVLRQGEWLYDHYVDLALYTILREEWLASTRASASV